MATGRTVDRWTRTYLDGYDISGMSRSVGNTGIAYDEPDLTTMSDSVKGYLCNAYQLNCESVNGVLDNTATTGLHTVGLTAGALRTLLVAYGILAEPAQGDVCFGGQLTQGAYQASSESGAMTVNIPFVGWAADATFNHFTRPFGNLLHAKGAETAVNSAVGIDDNGAATAQGGYMVYQVLDGDAGTITLKTQDAATNLDGSFADLTGCTSGSIAASAGVRGIVKATTSTVRRYLRWQAVFGTAVTCNFVIGFFRA